MQVHSNEEFADENQVNHEHIAVESVQEDLIHQFDADRDTDHKVTEGGYSNDLIDEDQLHGLADKQLDHIDKDVTFEEAVEIDKEIYAEDLDASSDRKRKEPTEEHQVCENQNDFDGYISFAANDEADDNNAEICHQEMNTDENQVLDLLEDVSEDEVPQKGKVADIYTNDPTMSEVVSEAGSDEITFLGMYREESPLQERCFCGYCNNRERDEQEIMKCGQCGEAYTTKSEQIIHDLMKHLNYKLKDHILFKTCKQRFETKSQIIRHERTHHDVKSNQCSQCRVVINAVSKMLHHEMECWSLRNISSLVENIQVGDMLQSGSQENENLAAPTTIVSEAEEETAHESHEPMPQLPGVSDAREGLLVATDPEMPTLERVSPIKTRPNLETTHEPQLEDISIAPDAYGSVSIISTEKEIPDLERVSPTKEKGRRRLSATSKPRDSSKFSQGGKSMMQANRESMTSLSSCYFPCGKCKQNVLEGEDAVCCDKCNKWIDARCLNLNNKKFSELAVSREPWICPKCDATRGWSKRIESQRKRSNLPRFISKRHGQNKDLPASNANIAKNYLQVRTIARGTNAHIKVNFRPANHVQLDFHNGVNFTIAPFQSLGKQSCIVASGARKSYLTSIAMHMK